MLLRLAWATLTRHRSRTLLAILGVAVSAAMLLDMVMLSSGMRASFQDLLLSRGFQLRLAPKGTLPFDTDATIPDASDVISQRCARCPACTTDEPGARRTAPRRDRRRERSPRPRSASIRRCRATMRSSTGRAPTAPNEIVASDDFLRASGAHDRRHAVGRRGLRSAASRVLGPANADASSAARTSSTWRRSSAPSRCRSRRCRRCRARARAIACRSSWSSARDGANVDSVLQRIERALPRVSGDLDGNGDAPGRRAAQLLPPARVHPRRGESRRRIPARHDARDGVGERATRRDRRHARDRRGAEPHRSADRARGHRDHGRRRARSGSALGLVTARYLNSILASFPGLPAAIDFFLFEPRDAWTALGLLVARGILAGVYPSWRGASLPIAMTLREEAVG